MVYRQSLLSVLKTLTRESLLSTNNNIDNNTDPALNAASDSKEAADVTGGLMKSSAVVATMTMLSRVLGLLRDVVIANFVGATPAADAFFVAFKIPNFMRRLFAEGAFSQAFVPVLAEYRQRRSLQDIQALINRVAAALGGTLLLFTGLAVVGAPVVTALFAPGFYMDEDATRYLLTSEMIRITFPYLLLISLTGFCGAVLNSYGRFAVPALTPVLLNLCLIGSVLLASPYFEQPEFALAWGVLVAGLIQLAFQLPFMHQLGLLPRPQWDLKDEGVKRVLVLMAPAIFGVSVSQINLLLDTVLASFLPGGSVSWLYYSDRLVELPLGVFAIAISTVILPGLSRQQASDSVQAFSATLDWAIRMVLFVGVPAAVALMVLAEPILMTLFQYGKLTVNDVTMASFSLQAYTVGLLAFMLIKVLAPGYFSRQDTKTPVKIGIIAMAANMVMNLVLVVPLHMYWQLGHVGLALATSLAAFLNAGLLYRGLRRAKVYQPQPGFVRHLLYLLLAAAAMSGLLLWLCPEQQVWGDWLWWQRALEILWLCAAGAGCYFACLLLLGVRPRDLRPRASGLEP